MSPPDTVGRPSKRPNHTPSADHDVFGSILPATALPAPATAPPGATAYKLPESHRLQLIAQYIKNFSALCISCYARGMQTTFDHTVEDCPHTFANNSDSDWVRYRGSVQLKPGYGCWGCWIDKSVRIPLSSLLSRPNKFSDPLL
jgi:hypothetical protein